MPLQETLLPLLEAPKRAIHPAPYVQIKVPGGAKIWQEYKSYRTDILIPANKQLALQQFGDLTMDAAGR